MPALRGAVFVAAIWLTMGVNAGGEARNQSVNKRELARFGAVTMVLPVTWGVGRVGLGEIGLLF